MSGYRSAIAVILTLGLASPASGQSELLDKGQSGFEINAGYSRSDVVNASVFSLGVSLIDRVDLRLTTANLFGHSKGGSLYEGSLTAYPIRQDTAGLPITTALDMSFQLSDRRETAYVLGMRLLHRIGFGKGFFVQPAIGIAYFDPTNPKYRSATILSYGLSLFGRRPSGTGFVIMPAVQRGDNVTQYSIEVGLFMPSRHDPSKKRR